MTHDDERSPLGPDTRPSTPVAFGDPTLDRDALSDEERRAIGPRRLSSSDWVLAGIIALTVTGTLATALASRGPALDKDAERPRVREAVLRHQLAEAARFVEPDASVFCLALFGGADPTPDFLARFEDHVPPVLPVSRCYLADERAKSRKAWLFSVGKIAWRWTGEVEVLAGAGKLQRYTLRREKSASGDGRWRVIRIEPVGR